jgi:hypothetical protein
VNCVKEGTSKLVLPGTPVSWIFIDRFSQFNIISSKAAGKKKGIVSTEARINASAGTDARRIVTETTTANPSMATGITARSTARSMYVMRSL